MKRGWKINRHDNFVWQGKHIKNAKTCSNGGFSAMKGIPGDTYPWLKVEQGRIEKIGVAQMGSGICWKK